MVRLKEPNTHQHTLEMMTLESLVPEHHLLRQIDAVIEFDFIRDKVRHLFCVDNGRPALDPVMLFICCSLAICLACGLDDYSRYITTTIGADVAKTGALALSNRR